MRIVAGKWKGRRLEPPEDARARPTADRVREAWMSIVQPDLHDARVLDLFAGSGALGLEALSRGAREVAFVELSTRSLSSLRDNIRLLGADAETTVHRGDALKFTAKLAADDFDVAFADPPYRLGLAEQLARTDDDHPPSADGTPLRLAERGSDARVVATHARELDVDEARHERPLATDVYDLGHDA